MFHKSNFDHKMHRIQRDMLSLASEIAKNNGTDLDFTDSSIKKLDTIIGVIAVELNEEGIRTQQDFLNSEGAQGIAEALACYFAACIERNYSKGVWVEDPNGGPWPIFIYDDKRELYPFDWIMKKLIDPANFSLHKVYAQSVEA